MNMKRVIMVLLASAILMGVYAQGQNEGKPAQSVEPTGPVKLQVWYALSGASGQTFVGQAQAFAKEHPEIELELTYSGSYADTATKVSAALLSGTAPDVAVMAAAQLYTGGQGNFEMESLVKDKDFDINDIYPGMQQYGMFSNRICALPYGISTQVLYYNKDIIAKSGIDLSTPPKTWDEFLKIAKATQQKGGAEYGFDTSDGVWLIKSMLSQNGNSIVEKKGDKVNPTFNQESGVQVATFWKKLVTEGVMPAGQHDNSEKKFLAGNMAFIAATSSRISKWKGNTSFALGAIPMPGFKKQSLALGGNVISIITTDKKKTAASWKLVKYMMQEPNQSAFALATGYLPVHKSSVNNPAVKEKVAGDPLYKVAIGQLDYAWAYLSFSEMGTMDNLIWGTLDEIEKGITEPKQAMDKAASDLLKEMKD